MFLIKLYSTLKVVIPHFCVLLKSGVFKVLLKKKNGVKFYLNIICLCSRQRIQSIQCIDILIVNKKPFLKMANAFNPQTIHPLNHQFLFSMYSFLH